MASTKGSVSGQKACGAPGEKENYSYWIMDNNYVPGLRNLKIAGGAEGEAEHQDAEDVEEGVGEQALEGIISSPGFNSGDDYPPNYANHWKIEVPKDKTIKINFTDYKVEQCCDVVRITDGDKTVLKEDKSKPGKKPFVSKTNTVEVFFQSDSSGQRRGWRLEWGELLKNVVW